MPVTAGWGGWMSDHRTRQSPDEKLTAGPGSPGHFLLTPDLHFHFTLENVKLITCADAFMETHFHPFPIIQSGLIPLHYLAGVLNSRAYMKLPINIWGHFKGGYSPTSDSEVETNLLVEPEPPTACPLLLLLLSPPFPSGSLHYT